MRGAAGYGVDGGHGRDASVPGQAQGIWTGRGAVMGDEGVVSSEVGAHKRWVARQYPAYQPNTCLISNGFCAMGSALPGAG